MIAAIERLMMHDTAGDPITGLKWTHKTTAKISRELRCAGIDISPNTVARLLTGLGYSLRVNHKKIAGKSHPCRDRQFRQITKTRRAFRRDGLPILSVDTKKKELIGPFKNPGVSWQKTPILVKDHDFRSEGIGMAVPYGVFDSEANRGRIFVGTSHDTPAFAVHALTQWWKGEGRRRYPDADHLLVLADSGGSNGARTRAWKHELQTTLCTPFAVAVTVCHYPPGASKWNPIEHRLFSAVSKSWAGQPLLSHETMIKYIRTTTTAAGLTVGATLVNRNFPTGQKVTDSQMQRLHLVRHRTLPVWNYTIRPAPSPEV